MCSEYYKTVAIKLLSRQHLFPWLWHNHSMVSDIQILTFLSSEKFVRIKKTILGENTFFLLLPHPGAKRELNLKKSFISFVVQVAKLCRDYQPFIFQELPFALINSAKVFFFFFWCQVFFFSFKFLWNFVETGINTFQKPSCVVWTLSWKYIYIYIYYW